MEEGAKRTAVEIAFAMADLRHYHLRFFPMDSVGPIIRVDLTWTKGDHEIFEKLPKLQEEKAKTNITNGYDGPMDEKPIIVNVNKYMKQNGNFIMGFYGSWVIWFTMFNYRTKHCEFVRFIPEILFKSK